jgi:hypothetical protein
MTDNFQALLLWVGKNLADGDSVENALCRVVQPVIPGESPRKTPYARLFAALCPALQALPGVFPEN